MSDYGSREVESGTYFDPNKADIKNESDGDWYNVAHNSEEWAHSLYSSGEAYQEQRDGRAISNDRFDPSTTQEAEHHFETTQWHTADRANPTDKKLEQPQTEPTQHYGAVWQQWTVPYTYNFKSECEEWLMMAVQLAGNAESVFLVDSNGHELGFGWSDGANPKPELLDTYPAEVFPLTIQFHGAQMTWESDLMSEPPSLSFSSTQPTAQKPNATRPCFSTGGENDVTDQVNQVVNDMVDAITTNAMTVEEALAHVNEEYDAESASLLSQLITKRINGNQSHAEGFVEAPAQQVSAKADTAYDSEAVVSAICVADRECKGYVLHKNGEFYLLGHGAHSYAAGEEWVQRVMVKQPTHAAAVDSSEFAKGAVVTDNGLAASAKGGDFFDAASMQTIPLVSPRSAPIHASPRNKARDLQLMESKEMSRLDAMKLAVAQAGETKNDEDCHRRDDLLGLYGTNGQHPADIWQTIKPNQTGVSGTNDKLGTSERTIGLLAKPSPDTSIERSRSPSTPQLGVYWITLWDSVVCRPECKYNACRDLWSCDEEEDFRDGEDLRDVEREGIARVSPIVPTFQTRIVNDFSSSKGHVDLSIVDLGLCCARKHRTP